MKNTTIKFSNHTSKIKFSTSETFRENISTRLSSVKSLLLITALLLTFANTYSQTSNPYTESGTTENNNFVNELHNKVPRAIFCINDDILANNQSIILCSDSPVQFTLCDAETGISPLNICWRINGSTDCKAGLVQGDVLFESTYEQGTYSIQVTSITDSQGNSFIGITNYNYSFEVISPSSVSAGNNMAICEGFTYTLNQATAENYNSLTWTGGDGTFVPSAQVLKPVYIPGPQDILNGGASLCLSAISENPCTSTASDCISLIIQQNATSNAGEDISVCATQAYVELNGLVENGFPVWEESLFTGGFFENVNANSTKYYFSNEDIELGTIELCLTGIPAQPCLIPQTDCLRVTIVNSPEANAGSDLSICAYEPVILNQAVAENYSTVQWSTMGDGVFVNPNALNTVYLPGINDFSEDDVQLCLNAYAQEVCTNMNTDCIVIDFIHAPAIELPAERSLVYEDYDVDNGKWLPVEIGNTVSGDYQSINWITNGDGTFDNASAESPAYFPGLNDVWNGEILIYVNIEPSADCHNPVFQGMTLHIPQQFVYYDNDGWNGISSYLSTDLSSVVEVMDPLVQIPESRHLVSMYDKQGKMYMPELNPPLTTLTNWEPIGYKINLKNTPACLPIYGDSLTNQTFTVDGSFTYLPTLTNVPVSIESLFEGHINDIMLIMDWSGNKLWTPNASDFDSIYPGYAYFLVNNSGIDPYTVEFPDFVADAPLIYPAHVNKNAPISNSPWAEVEKSDVPHIFTFTEHAMAKLQPGDILGAFNKNGECFGMAEYGNQEAMYKLIANGKSSISTDNTGFEEGETMYFKVYNYLNGRESEVTFIFDQSYPASNETFMCNNLSLVSDILIENISADQVSASTSYEVIVYPNPASDQLNITSGEWIEEVTILNTRGQEVLRMHTDGFSATLKVSDLRQGVYVLIIKHENQQITTQKITIR